jgi:hypothetical protein
MDGDFAIALPIDIRELPPVLIDRDAHTVRAAALCCRF